MRTTIKATFHIQVVGCKVNQVEAAMLSQQFAERGLVPSQDSQNAGLVILHTCTVTHKADRDCRRLIEQAGNRYPQAYLIITGCLAALEAERLRQYPRVLLVIDQANRFQAADLTLAAVRARGWVIDQLPEHRDDSAARMSDQSEPGFFSSLRAAPHRDRARTFIKVQDGCDGVCTYCRVRLARGSNISRPLSEVVQELQAYLALGYQEIVLTGVNLASYQPGLEQLLTALNDISVPFRIRLSSIEPQHLTTSLMDKLLAYQAWLCPHLHIPIQSGADRILAAMRRPYSRDDVLSKLMVLKKNWPRLVLTADMIVGFPGESDEDYDQSSQLAAALNLAKLHVFPFSPRPGTVAAGMKNQVVQRVITHRAKQLRQQSVQQQHDHLIEMIDQPVEILLETQQADGSWIGMTGEYDRAKIKINGRAGQLVDATIRDIEGVMLKAD